LSVPAAFYFDLGSVEAYLAAERALAVLPAPCEWQPILASMLAPAGTAHPQTDAREARLLREELSRRAAELELLPLRWPDPYPFDSRFAMLAATYAKRLGKTVAFALAAFRQAYAGANALDERDNVLIAAAACEIHPRALLAATRTRAIAAELERASAQALAVGVAGVPAVLVGERVLLGERALEEGGALLAGARS
jgi:2-hydroxychromene-2-carboxylate isomerase